MICFALHREIDMVFPYCTANQIPLLNGGYYFTCASSCISLVIGLSSVQTQKKKNTVEMICCKSKQTDFLRGCMIVLRWTLFFSSGEQLSLLFTLKCWFFSLFVCFQVLCPFSSLACCFRGSKNTKLGTGAADVL